MNVEALQGSIGLISLNNPGAFVVTIGRWTIPANTLMPAGHRSFEAMLMGMVDNGSTPSKQLRLKVKLGPSGGGLADIYDGNWDLVPNDANGAMYRLDVFLSRKFGGSDTSDPPRLIVTSWISNHSPIPVFGLGELNKWASDHISCGGNRGLQGPNFDWTTVLDLEVELTIPAGVSQQFEKLADRGLLV